MREVLRHIGQESREIGFGTGLQVGGVGRVGFVLSGSAITSEPDWGAVGK